MLRPFVLGALTQNVCAHFLSLLLAFSSRTDRRGIRSAALLEGRARRVPSTYSSNRRKRTRRFKNFGSGGVRIIFATHSEPSASDNDRAEGSNGEGKIHILGRRTANYATPHRRRPYFKNPTRLPQNDTKDRGLTRWGGRDASHAPTLPQRDLNQ